MSSLLQPVQDRQSMSTNEVIGQLLKEQEEREKRKNTSLPTQDLTGMSTSEVNQDISKRDSSENWILMSEKNAQLKFDDKVISSKIKTTAKAMTAQKYVVQRLEDFKAFEDCFLKEFLTSVEKKVMDAQNLLKNSSSSIQEMNDKIEKVTDETAILKSEVAKIEKVLNEYKRYRRVLFKLSPPEWQEAQKAATLTTKGLPDRPDGLEKDLDSTPDRVLPPTSESTLFSNHSDAVVKNSQLNGNNTIYEDKLELYNFDPLEVIVLLSELTDQNLSLIHNITRMDKKMEHTFEVTIKKMKEEEEQLNMHVEDMKERVDIKKKRMAMLKKSVHLHESIKTEDQDIMLNDLAIKVAKVYSSCVDERPTQLTTLEMLTGFEHHISLLFQQVESIPEDVLKTLRNIKDSEKRSRQREEKLKLEMEQHRERMKECIQRSLDEAKKTYGRKLMPRCFPVKKKIEVVDEVITLMEDFRSHLFAEDSD
ncbi:cilia- and flagella-associated protein 100 isoform X2 [Maylandia zebra]|uniref:cilia- and flagella-associated protein 100 isoform X2 n=1 Tax=Maylandia zebra TaxID=106582 RepID=UPI00403CA9DD